MLPTDKITAKDVMQLVTGISERTARRKIALCKIALSKEKKILTVKEFREYYMI